MAIPTLEKPKINISVSDAREALHSRNRIYPDGFFTKDVGGLELSADDLRLLSVYTRGDILSFLRSAETFLESAYIAETGNVLTQSDKKRTWVIDPEKCLTVLINTARLVDQLESKETMPISIKVDRELYFHEEGLFTANMAWDETRLLEIGFFVDSSGNIVIGKSQRHRLEDAYRKDRLLLGKYPFEKTEGDTIIRRFRKETGYSVETFGTVLGSLYLATGMRKSFPAWNDEVNFIEFNQRPGIQYLLEQKNRSSTGDSIEKAIESKRDMMDFRYMLEKIGIHTGPYFAKRYFPVERPRIKAGFERAFTDDAAYPDRLKYRRALYKIVTP